MLETVLLLATLNKALVDYLVKPLKLRWPGINLWFMTYVALVTGTIIGWFSGANVLADYVADVTTGRILTAILIGGGSNLINDLFNGTLAWLNGGKKGAGEA